MTNPTATTPTTLIRTSATDISLCERFLATTAISVAPPALSSTERSGLQGRIRAGGVGTSSGQAGAWPGVARRGNGEVTARVVRAG